MSPSFPSEPTATQKRLNKLVKTANDRLSKLNLLVFGYITVQKFCLELKQAEELEAWLEYLIPWQFLNGFSVIKDNRRVFNDGVNLREIAVLFMNSKRLVAIKELAGVTNEITTADAEIKALYAKCPDSHLRTLDNWAEEIKERLIDVGECVGSLGKAA